MPMTTAGNRATRSRKAGGRSPAQSASSRTMEDDTLAAAAAELRRVLDCRANVLVTGDVAAARAFFRARLSPAPREIDWRDLNREGPALLFAVQPGPEGTVFLDRIERLHRWVRAALLDALESRSSDEAEAVPRLISGCYRGSTRQPPPDSLESALFYRLGTITVHVPFRKRGLLRRIMEEGEGA